MRPEQTRDQVGSTVRQYSNSKHKVVTTKIGSPKKHKNTAPKAQKHQKNTPKNTNVFRAYARKKALKKKAFALTREEITISWLRGNKLKTPEFPLCQAAL